jgi:beta-galactosidase
LSRENAIDTIPVSLGIGNKLQIVVENQGRINYGIANDFKGILGGVYINSEKLQNWTMTGYPLDDYDSLQEVVDYVYPVQKDRPISKLTTKTGFVLFYGQFDIDKSPIHDTYIDPTGWGKGLIFINGFNLGRYWPVVGPQVTLYLPKELLKPKNNTVLMIECQKIKDTATILFTDTPNLDGN